VQPRWSEPVAQPQHPRPAYPPQGAYPVYAPTPAPQAAPPVYANGGDDNPGALQQAEHCELSPGPSDTTDNWDFEQATMVPSLAQTAAGTVVSPGGEVHYSNPSVQPLPGWLASGNAFSTQ